MKVHMKVFIYDKCGGSLYGPVTVQALAKLHSKDPQIPEAAEIEERLTSDTKFETADYCIIRQ